MTPREIAEKLHDHYCVQECRWHDKPGTILAGEVEITEAIDAATKPLREEIERLKAGGTYMCPHCGLSSPHYHKWSILHDPKDSDIHRWTVQAEGQIHFHFSDLWSEETPRLHAQAACDLLNHLEIRNRERADQAEASNRALVERLRLLSQGPW